MSVLLRAGGFEIGLLARRARPAPPEGATLNFDVTKTVTAKYPTGIPIHTLVQI